MFANALSSPTAGVSGGALFNAAEVVMGNIKRARAGTVGATDYSRPGVLALSARPDLAPVAITLLATWQI